jgi:hypothetical protein
MRMILIKKETLLWLIVSALFSILNSMLWSILGITNSYFDLSIVYLLTLIIFLIIPILDDYFLI